MHQFYAIIINKNPVANSEPFGEDYA